MTNEQTHASEQEQDAPTVKRLRFRAAVSTEADFTISLPEGGSGSTAFDADRLEDLHARLHAGLYDDEIIVALHKGKGVALRNGKCVLGWLDLQEGEAATVDVSEIAAEDDDQ